MKTLEKGKKKIQQICDALRHETLEPARQEGEQLISEAKAEAERIIQEAHGHAEKIIEAGRGKIEQEREILQASMKQGIKQALEALRQDIEHKVFNDELDSFVGKGVKDSQLVAKMIEAIIRALEKEGITADLSVQVPAMVSAEEVNAVLGQSLLERLQEQSVTVGTFQGGAKVKVHKKKLTIEITDAAIKDLLSRYVRKDFREMIFASEADTQR